MQFEGFGRSRPDFLPPAIIREIVQDLIERASSTANQSGLQSAEAAYQLAVMHFEGNCLPQDNKKCLEWLEKSAVGGYRLAISACEGLYESCNQTMSPHLQEVIRTQLSTAAETDLSGALADTMSNTFSQKDSCIAVRRWAEIDNDAYSDYITSPGYRGLLAGAVGIINIRENWSEMSDHTGFDFKQLEGYDPWDFSRPGPADKDQFINSVRRHKCVERTGVDGLTLLQRAAASGNLALARVMVLDLGAKVDGIGVTPDWTPLWISCFTGNIEVADFLATHGANPLCKDRLKSRTILHFLNKCRTEEELMKVLVMALKARIDIEVRDADGHTPLLSTFIGWDFSQGLASRYLLGLKANVLVKSRAGFSPFDAAVRSLDVDLLEQLCEAMDRSLLLLSSQLQAPDISPEVAKSGAFLGLGCHTEFYHRRLHGRFALAKFCRIVDLLLDEGSIRELRMTEYAKGTNPLISACFLAHSDLAVAVLLSSNCPPIDDVDETNQMTALQWATERGKTAIVMQLLQLGADPFLRSKFDYDLFQKAAISSPRLFMTVLEAMEAGTVPRPDDCSTRSILERKTPKGESIFALLVIEGSPEHLETADVLRVKYALPYDDMSVSGDRRASDTRMTLTAWLIDQASHSNAFTLQQVDYLLDLDPPPSFVADTGGATLLHYAVDAFEHGEDHQTGHSSPIGLADRCTWDRRS